MLLCLSGKCGGRKICRSEHRRGSSFVDDCHATGTSSSCNGKDISVDGAALKRSLSFRSFVWDHDQYAPLSLGRDGIGNAHDWRIENRLPGSPFLV